MYLNSQSFNTILGIGVIYYFCFDSGIDFFSRENTPSFYMYNHRS